MENQMLRIDRALTKLVLNQPFFATLALQLNMNETAEVPTFATDGKSLYINPEWCAKLSDPEIGTVLAHEVMHCALGHFWRAPIGADHQVWNMATDNEINWELEEYNLKHHVIPFPFPKCAPPIKEDRFRGMAAEKVYKTLMEEQQDQKSKGKGKGDGQSQPSMGEIMKAPENEKKELKEKWERALIQASQATKDRGDIPGKIADLIRKLTSSQVDWRTLLRDYITTTAKEDWSFRRANHRYMESEFIMPSLYNEKVGRIIFAIDTSGSITKTMLSQFLTEAQFALDEVSPEYLEIIYCDSAIQFIEIYEPGDIIKERVVGGGGTDFRPVFEYCDKMEEPPKLLIYMTDLYGEFPSKAPDYPVVWLVNTKEKVPFGDIIEVKC